MNDDLRELYQEMIVDHSKRPRNFKKLEGANRMVRGHNPLCGDQVTVYLNVEGDLIKDIAFEGTGCAISTASASMMTEALKGKTVSQAENLFGKFQDLVTGVPSTDDMGKLAVFHGVSEFPARVKCAILAWHAGRSALHAGTEAKSVESPPVVSSE